MDDQEVESRRVVRARARFRYYRVDVRGEAFDDEYARFVGSRYAIVVGSDTDALATALSALEVGPGQEVIVPAYVWISVAAAVVNPGAIPVLAHIDDTFCLDPEDIERRITAQTGGIIEPSSSR